MDNFLEIKYKALDELAEAERVWKTKKSPKVLDLIKDIKAGIKSENPDIVDQLYAELKKTNESELQQRQQIQSVKTTLIHDIDLAETNYKDNRTFEFNVAVNEAKRLIKKQKAELSDLQAAQEALEKCLKSAQNIADKAKQEALAKANEKAKLEGEFLKDPESMSVNLHKLAKFPPDSKTGENSYRPDWMDFDKKQNVWKVNENRLANDIVKDHEIRREEEKGKLIGYINYQTLTGLWTPLTPEGLSNFIDNYFSSPEEFSGSTSKQYAEDVHTAKAVKDTLTLLKSKIQKIDPKETFDTPNKYLVHLKDIDLDIFTFDTFPFESEHYFLSGLNTYLDTTTLTRIYNAIPQQKKKLEKKLNKKINVSAEHSIRIIAPETKKWLLKSLGGDNKTFVAFLERLGLSMIHDYSDNFIVFIYGAANTGKSMLFNYLHSLFLDSNVSALDLDLMAKSNSFDAQELRYKTINLTAESKVTSIDETTLNILEQLSGGDYRNYPQKFKNTADFKNFSHLWFNMNELPQLANFDDAIARRADVFKWHGISNFEEEIDWQKIEDERPQLILLALYYAHKVVTREDYYHYDYCGNVNLRLTRSDEMINNYLNWSKSKDYLDNFVESECQLGDNYSIGVGELVKAFNEFLHQHHVASAGRNQLTNDLIQRYNIQKSDKNHAWRDAEGKLRRGSMIYEGIATNDVASIQAKELISLEQNQYNG